MSDFEDIQRLVRLKRYEQPDEDFVEDFVRAFQQRQRSELLKQSARGLLWERVATYFEGLQAPKWGWGMATAVALLAALFVFQMESTTPAGQSFAASEDGFSLKDLGLGEFNKSEPISDEEIRQYLLSSHYKGGMGEEPAIRLEDPLFTPQPKPVLAPVHVQGGLLLPVGLLDDR